MPILDESHDFMHPVEDDPAWSESYYFNVYDPVRDTGLFTRIGVRPNEDHIDVGLSVWLPGGGLAALRHVERCHDLPGRTLAVGGVRYTCVAPMKEWELTCSGEARLEDPAGTRSGERVALELDLRFHALTPAIGVDGQGPARSASGEASRRSVGKGHLEQAGRWSGWIQVDGVRHTLQEARGNRDKSWGPRRWGGPRMWRWFSINLGDDMHLGGIRLGTEAGDLHRGWIWRDGRHTSIRRWDVRSELAEDGITHRACSVRAFDKRGGVHELRGEVLRVAPITHERSGVWTVINEGLTRWTCDGRTGYGISEYLHRLDASGAPIVAIE